MNRNLSILKKTVYRDIWVYNIQNVLKLGINKDLHKNFGNINKLYLQKQNSLIRYNDELMKITNFNDDEYTIYSPFDLVVLKRNILITNSKNININPTCSRTSWIYEFDKW